MDTKNEDTIVRQIEKNLSNNINENLFLTGRIPELPKETEKHTHLQRKNSSDPMGEPEDNPSDSAYPLVSNDYISNSPISISRAEYIRQAREACLRQMSSAQSYCRPYDSNYIEGEPTVSDTQGVKKDRSRRLFRGDLQESYYRPEENSPQEIAAFRALIIRTVCAIVIFLFLFVVDKFDITIGKVTPGTIQEYVTGKDTLGNLEDLVVTWLK